MAKKVLSILCAIAMMVTMLSVGMISVFAADNLGTVTRGEKSFGSLAWADSTYSETGASYTNACQKYYAFFNTELTGDAMMGLGKGMSVTLTNKETVTLGNEFAFSFRYSYFPQNATYRVVPYADINIGAMNIHIQTVVDDTTNDAPTVAITYGNTSLSAKATSVGSYEDAEIDAMYNAGLVANQGAYSVVSTVWTGNHAVGHRYVDVSVQYKDGTLTLTASGATDSAEVDLDITNAAVTYTVGNESSNNVSAGLSNWEGSYYSEEYIPGDSGEGEEGENTGYVSNIASGTDLLVPSTLTGNVSGTNYGVSTTVYAASNNGGSRLDFSTNAFWNATKSDYSVTSSSAYNFGENFAVTATMIIINQQQGNPSSGFVSLGDIKLSFDRVGSSTASAVTIKLTNGDTVLGTYTTQAAPILDSTQYTGSQLHEKTETEPNGTYTFRYVDGALTVLYKGNTLTFKDGNNADATSFQISASKFNNINFTVGVISTLRTSFIGNCVYTNYASVSGGEDEEGSSSANIESGTDLLAPTAVTGYTTTSGQFGLDKSVFTGSGGYTLALDTYALWATKFNGVNTATSIAAYNFGTNFEVSANMVVRNQSNNPTSASMAIGDVKLEYSRDASNNVTIVLTDGTTTLGTYTTTVASLADGTQFGNGNIALGEPNGTYTFKYDGTNLTVLFNGTAMTFDTGSSFPMDASAFTGVTFSASVKSNGRANFVYNCVYTNLTPIIDKDLKFHGASLTLGNGIGMNFYVAPAVSNAYTDLTASVKYIENGEEATKTYSLTDIDGFKGFTFNYYSPNQKDVPVYVTLIGTKNGKVGQGAEVQYSINAYMNNMTSKYSDDEKLMNVIDALDEYCDATAAYAAGEDYSYGKTPVVLTKDSDYHLDIQLGGSDVLFAGCSLNIREVPSVIFAFRTKENIYNYTFEITKENGVSETITANQFVNANNPTEDGDLYYIYYRDVTAVEMRNTITGQMFNTNTGEAASDAITYSVVSYAYYQAQKAEKTILYHLTQAMIAYGDAVVAYVAE